MALASPRPLQQINETVNELLLSFEKEAGLGTLKLSSPRSSIISPHDEV
jgi:hypothetical protein